MVVFVGVLMLFLIASGSAGYMSFVAELFNLDVVPPSMFSDSLDTLFDRCVEQVRLRCRWGER